ncbi:MAG: hypothetical protein OEZ22_14660 [Spirochaetia bacterium]|nr:hypothetical protein [Spirochaetia bacterium]
MKTKNQKLLSAICVCLFILNTSVYSQEADEKKADETITETSESNVKKQASDMALVIRGGFGFGPVDYGFEAFKTDRNNVMSGSAFGADIGAMFNYRFIAAEIGILFSLINDLEGKQDYMGIEKTVKYMGTGTLVSFDIKLGAKLLTKPGDMGYIFPFIGLRNSPIERKLEKIEIDGNQTEASGDTLIEPNGLILGFRDLTTVPLGSFSLLIQSGFFLNFSMADERTDRYYDMTKNEEVEETSKLNKPEPLGMGFEIGLGAAFEDAGLSVFLNYKWDQNGTIVESEQQINGEYPKGLFYADTSKFYLTVTKEIPF